MVGGAASPNCGEALTVPQGPATVERNAGGSLGSVPVAGHFSQSRRLKVSPENERPTGSSVSILTGQVARLEAGAQDEPRQSSSTRDCRGLSHSPLLRHIAPPKPFSRCASR